MVKMQLGAGIGLRNVPGLDELAGTRPEMADAPKIWAGQLAPALQARESERRTMLRRVWRKTALAAMIPVLAVLAMTFAARSSSEGWVMALFLLVPLSMFLIAGFDWLRVFSMKMQTKELVLNHACAPFGFTYETLYPDVSGVTDIAGLFALGRAYGGKYKAAHPQRGDASFGFSNATGPDCPTPAYDTLRAARLLPGHDTRAFEDLIRGERAGAQFAMVEARLATSGENGGTTFQGLLFHVRYPQAFLGRTVMARSGWWKRGKDSDALQKVSLVSDELDKAFTVYATDQVEARALLTPDRMERLIALERHFSGGKLRGVFEDGHMTLALEAPNQFEAGSIFKPLVDPKRFASALVELGLVCDMIDGFLSRDWAQDRL